MASLLSKAAVTTALRPQCSYGRNRGVAVLSATVYPCCAGLALRDDLSGIRPRCDTMIPLLRGPTADHRRGRGSVRRCTLVRVGRRC